MRHEFLNRPAYSDLRAVLAAAKYQDLVLLLKAADMAADRNDSPVATRLADVFLWELLRRAEQELARV